MMVITPDELDKLEQEVNRSSLDEPTKNLLNDVIAARRTLIGLMEKLIEAPENLRDEICEELAEFLDHK